MIKFLIMPFLTICLCFTTSAFADEPHQTSVKKHKNFTYEVRFKKTKIGTITRNEKQNNHHFDVRLTADLSFFFFKFGGYQHSSIAWFPDIQWFKTQHFERYSKGLENIYLNANIHDDFHSSTVEVKDNTMDFHENKGKITDLNAMLLQVQFGLLSGQKKFDFYMQTSDEVNHYFFEVKGREKIKTKFGEFNTYKLEQTQVNNRSLSVWFAPELNMQMVKFNYQRKVVDITGTLQSYTMK